MLTKILATLGVALVIPAACLYVLALRLEASMEPLSFPVSLSPGIVTTQDFTTAFNDSQCEIAVDWGAKINGKNTDPMSAEISWQLFDGAKIAEGNSENNPSFLADRTQWERHIGSFQAQKGHHYRLVLRVNGDAAAQNVAHPRILVQIPSSQWEGYAMALGFLKLIAEVLGIAGLLALFGAFAMSKSKPATRPIASAGT